MTLESLGMVPASLVTWHYGTPYRIADADGATITIGRMVYRHGESVPYVLEGIADRDHVTVWDGIRAENVPLGAFNLTLQTLTPDNIATGWDA